ncbi:unnamed protein product, partial [Symbiodinium pilosum]
GYNVTAPDVNTSCLITSASGPSTTEASSGSSTTEVSSGSSTTEPSLSNTLPGVAPGPSSSARSLKLLWCVLIVYLQMLCCSCLP